MPMLGCSRTSPLLRCCTSLHLDNQCMMNAISARAAALRVGNSWLIRSLGNGLALFLVSSSGTTNEAE